MDILALKVEGYPMFGVKPPGPAARSRENPLFSRFCDVR
jgi:hypothetical protein